MNQNKLEELKGQIQSLHSFYWWQHDAPTGYSLDNFKDCVLDSLVTITEILEELVNEQERPSI